MKGILPVGYKVNAFSSGNSVHKQLCHKLRAGALSFLRSHWEVRALIQVQTHDLVHYGSQ